MADPQILAETTDGVVTITMNRPERLNAWTYQMQREMVEVIDAGNADPDVIAFILTGAGRGFCAGADIGDVFKAQADGEQTDRVGRDWVGLIRESKPFIAAVNGAAIGVGLTQILPMDHIVGAEGAKLSLRFVKMGVVPELASSKLVPMRCGFGVASDLMLTGRTILAEEAHTLGLIDRVVAPDDLLGAAHEMATAMGENPQSSIAFAKQLLTENMTETELGAVQRRELELLAQAYKTPEHKEAIAAFLEKRDPDFAAARRSAD